MIRPTSRCSAPSTNWPHNVFSRPFFATRVVPTVRCRFYAVLDLGFDIFLDEETKATLTPAELEKRGLPRAWNPIPKTEAPGMALASAFPPGVGIALATRRVLSGLSTRP